jgi:predicted nucleotidyltransferase
VGIAKIVKTIDRSALAAARRGDLLKTVFSSMLQLLMTGQVRVRPEVVTMCQQRQTPSSARTPRIGRAPDPRIVQAIVDRIVAAVAPEKIILFGSAALGEMGPDSDLDFLVVKSCENRRKVAQTIYGNLIGVGVPKDIVVVTPEDVERHRDTIGYIIRPALREGRVVYVR